MARKKKKVRKSAGTVALPLRVGRGEAPVQVEVKLVKRKPKGAKKNVAKVSVGGEDFFIVAGKTVLA